MADIEPYQKAEQLGFLLQKLPLELHARAKRYRFESDTYAFVLGRLLLISALEELDKGHLFDRIEIAKNGKPYLEGLFFNISHTENRVVCAISTKGEVGIDIEKIKPINLQNFVAFFTKKEMQAIQIASNSLQEFYRFWTRKESIIKALGANLAYLHQIETDPSQPFFYEKEKQWFVQDLDFGEGYLGAICTDFEFEKKDIDWIKEIF